MARPIVGAKGGALTRLDLQVVTLSEAKGLLLRDSSPAAQNDFTHQMEKGDDGILGPQEDFPEERVLIHQAVGRGGLLQRKDLVNGGSKTRRRTSSGP